jgi:hypothetical protein
MRKRGKTKVIGRVLLALLALTGAGLVYLHVSHASLLTLRFTQSELQEKITEKFPVKYNLLVLTAELHDPEVRLANGSDRIGLAMNVTAKAAGKTETGSAVADGTLRYEPENGTLYLDDATLRELHIEGLSENTNKQARPVLSSLLRASLSRIPIYRPKSGDFRQELGKRVVKSVAVRDGKLVVDIGPP